MKRILPFLTLVLSGCDVLTPTPPVEVSIRGPSYAYGKYTQDTYRFWRMVEGGGFQTRPGYKCEVPLRVEVTGGRRLESRVQTVGGGLSLRDPETQQVLWTEDSTGARIPAEYALLPKELHWELGLSYLYSGRAETEYLDIVGPRLPFEYTLRVSYYNSEDHIQRDVLVRGLCMRPE